MKNLILLASIIFSFQSRADLLQYTLDVQQGEQQDRIEQNQRQQLIQQQRMIELQQEQLEETRQLQQRMPRYNRHGQQISR